MNVNFSRSLTRLTAVQILYALDSKNELTNEETNIEKIIKESRKYNEKNTDEKINSKFLKRLLTLTIENLNELDQIIISNLKKDNESFKINILLNSILRSGVCELLHFKTPTKVTIDEYIKLTKKFFDEEEIGFVNALLDRASKKNCD